LLDVLSASSPANGAIARAREQVEEASRRRAIEQAPRARLNRAIAVIDSMIAMLERHNLKGTPPPARVLETGLSEVIRATAHLGISVGRGRSIRNLMNELFAAQKRLMAMRAGPGWEWAYEDEDGELGEARIERGEPDCA